jgi:hypothetical protein
VPHDGWDRPAEFVSGVQPVRNTARSRWREIVVHHVDLDVGFDPADLPADYRARDADWLAEFRPGW